MRIATRCFLIPALLACVCVGATPAHAGDERPVELPLVNGKTLKGVVQQIAGDEVLIALGGGKLRRIPWSQLTPLAVYRVKAALAPVAEGEARKKLALLAADLGLYTEARIEYEKALALGALTQKEYKHLVAKAERHAVEAGVNHARKIAEAGDLERALDIATDLRLHFAGAPNAKAVGKLIQDLLRLVEKLDKEAAKAQKELEDALVDLQKNKEIIRRKTEALAQVKKGIALTGDSEKAQKKGQVSRAHRNAEKADAEFTKARRNLGRLRRILPRRSEMRRDVLAKLVELDKAQFDLLFNMAWFMWESKVWSRAELYAAKASYIDPVHPELIELRDELASSRIKYRLSDMTNARPIVR
ncbi:MAG: hypothetical protein QNJ98_03110 [Planctomycetota bacterium]|nr:hypothetical protein [Planctomycetota bacterium]